MRKLVGLASTLAFPKVVQRRKVCKWWLPCYGLTSYGGWGMRARMYHTSPNLYDSILAGELSRLHV